MEEGALSHTRTVSVDKGKVADLASVVRCVHVWIDEEGEEGDGWGRLGVDALQAAEDLGHVAGRTCRDREVAVYANACVRGLRRLGTLLGRVVEEEGEAGMLRSRL